MNAIQRHLGLLMSSAIVAASVWACTATRNPDGSVSVEFSPDMTIKARSLESLLKGLGDLLESCIAGTFPRPCTDGEIDSIIDAMEKVLQRKERITEAPTPAGPTGVG